MTSGARSTLKQGLVPLLFLVAGNACLAQETEPASSGMSTPMRYALPAVEIIGFDFALNRFNHRFSGSTDYDVSGSTIQRNLRRSWVVDNDPFSVNQFAHPYQGSLYHNAARSFGLNYWESSAYTFVGSAWWEITGEKTPPSRNDQVASGIAGSFLGEPLFRMARLLVESRSNVPYAWRQWGAAAVSPAYGLNRLAFGASVTDTFDDHDPIYYSRLRVGGSRVTKNDAGASADLNQNSAEIDFAMDYGLPGNDRYTYDRPFDYFSFRAVASTANRVQSISSRGLLFGSDYSVGDNYRGILGLYANYDYLAPQIFNLSATALSLGTTGQWWATKDVALQGTVLAGLGYSAGSTARPTADDRNYHYGMAPRLGVSLRMIAGSRASFDIDAEKYFLGHIANRAAGKDDISHLDAAFTWRLTGRHAIGVKYVLSRRDSSLPIAGDRSQTLGTVGLYYTLLGLDTFGTVDWRDTAPK